MVFVVLFFFAAVMLVAHQGALLPVTCWAMLVLLVRCLPTPVLRTATLAFILGGLFATQAHTLYQSQRLSPEKHQVCGVVQISSVPKVYERYTSFEAHLTRYCEHASHQPLATPAKLKLYWFGKSRPDLIPGQFWRASLSLKPPRGLENQHGFDQTKHWYRHGVVGVGSVRQKPAPQLMNESTATIRQTIFERLKAAFTNEPNLGLVQALVIGERVNVSQDQWQLFRDTGTSHLMAISGLHVGVVLGFVYVVVSLLWRLSPRACLCVPSSSVAAVAALLAAAFYCHLADWSLPTIRAFTMAICFLAFPLTGLHMSLWRRWVVALFLILLFDPKAVLGPGLFLSFGAVAAIIYWLNNTESLKPWLRWLGLHLFISLALAPVVMWWFDETSIVSPLANMLAIPIASIAVPLLLLATALLMVWQSLGMVLFTAAFWLLNVMQWILMHITQLAVPSVSLWVLLGSMVLLVSIAVWVFKQRKHGVVMLFVTLFTAWRGSEPSTPLKVTVFDVGQGLAVLIQTRSKNVLYDTGSGGKYRADRARQVILPHLKAAGVDKLDSVIISHSDNDHAGGVSTIAENIDVGEWRSGTPENLAVSALPCVAGKTQMDGVTWQFYPSASTSDNTNNRSCVLKIGYQGASILLPGDIERARENKIMHHDLKADVLIAPHHGSRSSSSPGFIRAVGPRHVIFTTGYLNQHRHPANVVEKRYAAIKSNAMNTAYDGAITLKVIEGRWKITTHAQNNTEFWRY